MRSNGIAHLCLGALIGTTGCFDFDGLGSGRHDGGADLSPPTVDLVSQEMAQDDLRPVVDLLTVDLLRAPWSPAYSVASNTPLYGVWASAPNDLWAVGDKGTIIHGVGAPESMVYGPVALATANPQGFRGVWGGSNNNIYAVGVGGKIYFYNGTTWTALTSPTNGDLNGVGGKVTDVWFSAATGGAIYRRFGGGAITMEDSRVPVALYGISAAGTQVWAVGDKTTNRWDDASATPRWVAESNPSASVLRGVFALATNDVWAAGDGGTVLHFNGTAWTATASGTTEALNGVWASGPRDVWFVGNKGTILHYDGGALAPSARTTMENLTAVWGASPTAIWAVSDKGTVLRY